MDEREIMMVFKQDRTKATYIAIATVSMHVRIVVRRS